MYGKSSVDEVCFRGGTKVAGLQLWGVGGKKPSFSQTEKSVQGSMKWHCKDFKWPNVKTWHLRRSNYDDEACCCVQCWRDAEGPIWGILPPLPRALATSWYRCELRVTAQSDCPSALCVPRTLFPCLGRLSPSAPIYLFALPCPSFWTPWSITHVDFLVSGPFHSSLQLYLRSDIPLGWRQQKSVTLILKSGPPCSVHLLPA